MAAHSKKIENVLRLDEQSRCDYFVRKVADFEVVWGLFDTGWATASAGATTAVPFWPEEEFAALCATAEWQRFHPKSIALDDFLGRWLPGMEKDHRVCVVFSTPTDRGSLLHPRDLDKLIRQELEQYE
ncbi:MAG TPA: DUF2750 domain-containing protein [Trinickia sp.]|uniref:DUF2750 domain-containing protein n=1 Tax=Trinickia sp. TaxID=2571163 RepID=UPI002C77F08D|nr:DUF2750 domain-containing protein [Trinickia sp.]HVW50489.1 DUF2750 domain-containing protein [Trinickia sp.]